MNVLSFLFLRDERGAAVPDVLLFAALAAAGGLVLAHGHRDEGLARAKR